MNGRFASFRRGTSPVLAVALHSGHQVRPEVARCFKLSEADRRREEDPFTGRWTVVSDNRVVCHQSRFEVDLNRPRELSVYATPEMAWGLDVWQAPLSPMVLSHSLARYDRFYHQIQKLIASLLKRHRQIVVLDLHTYNHRRGGPDAPPEDPAGNPEINIGTGTMDRERWAPVVDRCIADLRAFDFLGRSLDVRENVRFQGGNFPRWLHTTFPHSVCALAIEVKKFFMNEWTGELEPTTYAALVPALRSIVPGLIEELGARRREPTHAA